MATEWQPESTGDSRPSVLTGRRATLRRMSTDQQHALLLLRGLASCVSALEGEPTYSERGPEHGRLTLTFEVDAGTFWRAVADQKRTHGVPQPRNPQRGAQLSRWSA